MYEHNTLGYWSGLVLCLTKVRSSRARCPATALISHCVTSHIKHACSFQTRNRELAALLAQQSQANEQLVIQAEQIVS